MAPLPFLAVPETDLSTTTTISLSNSDLRARSPDATKPTSTRPVDPNYTPGAGAFDPRHLDNRGIFALFALVGASLVLAAIWFFFWAKNGGFHFKKGDWDDYKSTVLRRKGPNGTTLSGATRTTKLGGGSVVAEGAIDIDEKGCKRGVQRGGGNKVGQKPRGNKNNDDADVRAYRHEKPARVGGLNRDSDGVAGRDFADSGYSDSTSQPETGFQVPINPPRVKKSQQPTTPSPNKDNKKKAFYRTPASNTSTDSHRPLRPNKAHSGSNASTPSRSRNSSPQKPATMPGSFYTDSLDFENRYSQSEAGVSEDSWGTKSYYHPMSGRRGDGGLGGREGRAGGAVGGTGGGFRRGGRGRRDSLSDSEGETVMS